MDRKNHWKKKPLDYGSDEARLRRAADRQNRRQDQRERERNRHRQIETFQECEEEDIPESKAVRLAKWKAERDLKKKLEAHKKKPAFKVGVPHHKLFSPTSNDPPKPHYHKKLKDSTPPKRLTQVTLRRMAAKAARSADQGHSKADVAPQQSEPDQSTSKAKHDNTGIIRQTSSSSTGASLAPDNYEFKIPIGIAPVPLFGEFFIPEIDLENFNFNLSDDAKKRNKDKDNLTSLQKQNEMTPPMTDESPNKLMEDKSVHSCDSSIETVVLRMSSQYEASTVSDQNKENHEEPQQEERCDSPVPAQFSPFIVTSRGKSSARKEQKQRLSLYKRVSLQDDIPTKDTVMQNLNISIEEEERTAQYYKFLLQSEENRLNELCTTWKIVQDNPDTPEDGQYMINQAIGQTNLLIRKKFDRFRNLVLDCETGKGEQLVRCKDLQGFWEMMEMEIKDCNLRFVKLEELKTKDWTEDEPEQPAPVVMKKKQTGKSKKIVGKSNMKSFIAAARKKKLTSEKGIEENIVNETPSFTPPSPRRSFSKQPVSPHSKGKAVTPRTERMSLLKQVQLSESTRKLAQSSMVMVAVSQKCKTPEVQHDTSISYVNSDQTPGKGILKSNVGRSAKTQQKVNFNDTLEITEVPVDPEVENKRSLAASLAAIDSFDFGFDDEPEHTRINKKLEFLDDDLTEDNKPLVLPELKEKSIENDGNNNTSSIKDESQLLPVSKVIPDIPNNGLMLPPAVVSKASRKTKWSQKSNVFIPVPDIDITPATPTSPEHEVNEREEEKFAKNTTHQRRSSRLSKTHPEKVEMVDLVTPIREPGTKSTRNSIRTPLTSSTPDKSSKIRESKADDNHEDSLKKINKIETKKVDKSADSVSDIPCEFSASENDDEDSQGTSVSPVRWKLRNRSILMENNITIRNRRKSQPHKREESLRIDKENTLTTESQDSFTTPRKSTRKIIKLLPEDDCGTCNPVGSTSKTGEIRISLFGEAEAIAFKTLPNGDLMSFDTPVAPRTRHRRASHMNHNETIQK